MLTPVWPVPDLEKSHMVELGLELKQVMSCFFFFNFIMLVFMNFILKGFSEFIGSSSPILQVKMLLPYLLGVRQYSKDFKTVK